MKYFLQAILLATMTACGGGSGSDNNAPADRVSDDESGQSDDFVEDTEGGEGSREGDGSLNCNNPDCVPNGKVRSVIDSRKFVDQCQGGLVFVDDLCGPLRVEVTLNGEFEVGNTVSRANLFSGEMLTGKRKYASYMKQKPMWDDSNEEFEVELFYESDWTSTWRQLGNQPTIMDSLPNASTPEIYFSPSGRDYDEIPMDVIFFGHTFSGTNSFEKLKEFCQSAAESFSASRVGQNVQDYSSIRDGYVSSGGHDCELNSTVEVGMEKWNVSFHCKDSMTCFANSVSLWYPQ